VTTTRTTSKTTDNVDYQERKRKDTPFPLPTGLGNRNYGIQQSNPPVEEKPTAKVLNLNYIKESSPQQSPDDNLDRISVISNCSNNSEISATALQQIREQMAFSLKRMRDLEDQVKMIPILQEQLQSLKEERRQLQLQLKSEELKSSSSSSNSPSPQQSQQNQGQQIFQPYRVSPVSLNSLEKHIKLTKQQKTVGTSTAQILKRDVGCSPISTSVPQAPPKTLRSVSCATDLTVPINLKNPTSDHLYREIEMKKSIEMALIKYKREKLNNMVTIGTQISKICHGSNIIQGPITSNSIGVDTNFETPKPKLNFHKIPQINILDRDRGKLTIDRGINTDENLNKPLETKTTSNISLKAITDFQSARSRSFALGEADEKPVVRRKTRETQTMATAKQSVGVQHVTRGDNKAVQSGGGLGVATRTTDTGDLIKIRNQHAMTERISKKDQQSTTQDLVKRRDYGINTTKIEKPAAPVLRTTAANTERIETKTIGVSCNVETTVKQQKISTHAVAVVATDDSKIPRPSTLFSPTSQRKFVRQNTFTIAKNSKLPSPSPVSSVDSKPNFPESREEENICPAEVLLRLSTQQKATNNSLLEASLIKQETPEQQHILITSRTVTTVSEIETEPERKEVPEKPVQEVVEEVVVALQPEPGQQQQQQKPEPEEEPEVEHERLKEDNLSQFPMSPSIEYLESNVDEDEDYDDEEDDDDKLGNMRTSHPPLPPPPTSISSLRLSQPDRAKIKPSKEMMAALKVINDHLKKYSEINENAIFNAKVVASREWFQISSIDTANPLNVEDYLDYYEECSSDLLRYMVNLTDPNGNTAMHYAVSHGNFDVVSILLDSKVCNVNQTNNAGYTCVMLVSLAELKIPEHRTVVQRLFQMSDVNIRALKHSQTALMLAVSHGNLDMVQMLIEAGADINIQDDDGSTALMCAAEHGHIDIVKYLLAQPDCDSTKQDVDGSTALKISLEAGYHDIGCLLYAHEHLLRNKSPNQLKKSSRDKKDSTHSTGMSSSQSSLH
jgi:hypothetical protein